MNSSSNKFEKNVFSGESAVKDFLNPENSPPIPLVEIPDALNPNRMDGVRVFAKLMYLLPLLNIKSLPVMSMLNHAQTSGELHGVHTLVESSSGNAAFSLAVMGPLFNIPRTIAVVPWDIAPGKLEALRLAGVEPILTRNAPGLPSGIAEARSMGEREGYFNAGQYGNEANPDAFEKWLAPEIWEQTQGKLTVFATGLGTTGTLVGSSRYFRGLQANVCVVGGICRPDEPVPGVRSRARLAEIEFDWNDSADAIIEVGTKESFKKSLQLCRSGLLGGPSSGFALAALDRFLAVRKEQSTLDRLRNDDGDVLATFICGDTPFPYLDKYTTHLDPSDF